MNLLCVYGAGGHNKVTIGVCLEILMWVTPISCSQNFSVYYAGKLENGRQKCCLCVVCFVQQKLWELCCANTAFKT